VQSTDRAPLRAWKEREEGKKEEKKRKKRGLSFNSDNLFFFICIWPSQWPRPSSQSFHPSIPKEKPSKKRKESKQAAYTREKKVHVKTSTSTWADENSGLICFNLEGE
jgi:hypothetical protein